MIEIKEKQCRLCLEDCSNDSKAFQEVEDLYQQLTNVELYETVPQKICTACDQLIHQVQSFFQTCSNTETVLKSLQEPLKIEDEVYQIYELVQFEEAVPLPLPPAVEQPDEKPPRVTSLIACEECGYLIPKARIKHHKARSHAEATPRFVCDLCSKSYKSKIDLKLHIRKIHLGILNYPCKYCGRVFKDWSTRHYHNLTLHEPSRLKFACDFCPKKFTGKFRLDEHRAMHLDVRKHQCSDCEKSFKKVRHLNDHRKTVHANGRLVTCDKCEKCFKDRKGLRQHAKTHMEREFRCPVCPTTFTVGHTLRTHMRTRHPNFPMPPLGTPLRNVDLSVYLKP